MGRTAATAHTGRGERAGGQLHTAPLAEASMVSGRSLRGQSAEHTAAVRRAHRPWTILRLTAVAVLAGLGVPMRAAALITTGGPVYTLPGGGSCTLSGTAAS